MVAHVRVTAAFRRLVALVARAFYAGECPPKTPEEIAASASSRTKQQGTTHGLAIILLDALIGKDNQDKPVEWIKEEDLAESLNLHIKLVRKTLRFLEQEQLLAREHMAESARSRKKQAAAEAAAGRGIVTGVPAGEAEDGNVEGLKADVISWCCIDYPSLVNVVLLRLYKMRRALQDQASDRHTIQKYLCQRCQRTYTSLDIATFPMQNLGFLCERCSEEGYDVALRESYQGQDGDLVDAKERAQRVAQAKQMQKAVEDQLKPLVEQLDKLKNVPVPDFGPQSDWAANLNAAELYRKRRAAGGGGGHSQRREGELEGIDLDFDDTQVEVKLQGANGEATAEASAAAAVKALPPWMLRQGITSTSAAPTEQQMGTPVGQAATAVAARNGASTSEVIASEEDQKRIEEEYLKQYMAQVMAIQERQQAARAGTLDTQGHQELQDLKVELAVAEAEVDEAEVGAPAKRVKVEGGWSPEPQPALLPDVKPENELAAQDGVPAMPSVQQAAQQSAANGVDDDLNEWEDVDVNRAPTEVKAESSNQQLADDDEWEDV